ncbi:MAG TPA: RDD family protein [Stellaceae bacterium]|nr:RDD family protein [Stellaceae bacterium]
MGCSSGVERRHLIPSLAGAAMITTCCAVSAAHGPNMASFGYASSFYDDRGMPDPAALPEAYEGVLWRRTLAYFVDLCLIGVIAVLCWIVFAVLWVLSFGLLGPVLWFLFGLIPLAYHTLLLSGPRSATVGMRLFDVELRSVTGERPGFLQALIQTALFYITVGVTCSLILLLVLFNRHKRTLHDLLAGTVVVRRFPVRWATAQDPRPA